MTVQEPLFPIADARGGQVAPADPFTAAVPAWLLERLDDVNPERRSAYSKLVPCRKCQEPVLVAADMGLDLMTESRVDPRLLDAATELAVLLAGRYTVEADVLKFGRGIMLYRRDRWLIQKPSGTRRRFTVPEHRCGSPDGVPIPWQMLYPNLYEQTHNLEEHHNDTPPF